MDKTETTEKSDIEITLGITFDPWQLDVLKSKGNIVLRSGRQVGKSTIIAVKAAHYALINPNKTVMVIAKVERQAQLLFAKILRNIQNLDKTQIMKGKKKPTKHIINLKNGSIIHCLPAGDMGYGIMGFTIDLLIADEAAFIPEEVWISITPSLAITRGSIWLLSTPFVKSGYYYRCFKDKNFTAFHTSSEDCPRKDEDFLNYQKSWMTNAQYAQMYLGEFRDELRKFIPTDLIKQVCILKRQMKSELLNADYFLGVDVGGMGGDPSTFENLNGTDKENIRQVDSELTYFTRTTETTQRILRLNRLWDYNQIGIDDGGMGVGVFDQLLIEEDTRRKTIALNNASRTVGKRTTGFGKNMQTTDIKKRLLKEDMYNNLLNLMERQEIKLLDDDEVFASLDCLQYEHTEKGMKVYGINTHIAEGLIRAAWLIKNKKLNPYVM